MQILVDYILIFFTFAFVGWCIEVTLKYIQYHRFINRGFLMGPWLPIYGFGVTLIVLSVNVLSPVERSYGTTFVISFFVCGIVEYMASYIMEKRFHARWWDYSQKPMNLNGRVWIGNLLMFGIGGVLVMEITDPLVSVFHRMDISVRYGIAGTLSAIFIADYVVSHFVLKLVKIGVETSEADNTEEIGREIKLLLSDRNIFYRRFAQAYPDVIYKTEKIAARMDEIKAETKRLRNEAAQRVSELDKRITDKKAEFAEGFETTESIKNKIIIKQHALISMLYDETCATEDERQIKSEIDTKSKKLQKRGFYIAEK